MATSNRKNSVLRSNPCLGFGENGDHLAYITHHTHSYTPIQTDMERYRTREFGSKIYWERDR